MRVALTGSSGLIGSALAGRLQAGGCELLRLVRREPRADDEIRWDPGSGVASPERLEGLHGVVHLAGEPVAERWTEANRARIRESRLRGTRSLVDALRGLARPPAVLVSASAVGVYGADRGDEVLTEESAPGGDFLAELGVGWEEEAGRAAEAGIRVVQLRFGVVLSPRGGALGRMLLPFRLGGGGPIGGGRQWMSWISLTDVVELIHRALTDGAMEGPYNAVAGAVRNRDFARTLGRVLHRPAILPAPVPLLRLVFGREMLESTLLASQRVEPARLTALGHRFRHPTLEDALHAELRG